MKILVILYLFIGSIMTQERELIVTSQQLNPPQPSKNDDQVEGIVVASDSSKQKQQIQVSPAQQEGKSIEPDKIQSEINEENNKQQSENLGSLNQLPLQTQQTIKEEIEHQQTSQAEWAVSVNATIKQQQSKSNHQELPANQQGEQPVKQPVNQPEVQSYNEQESEPAHQPKVQPINQKGDQPGNQQESQHSNQQTVQPVTQPESQPANQPEVQSDNQEAEQPVHQPKQQAVNQQGEQAINQDTGDNGNPKNQDNDNNAGEKQENKEESHKQQCEKEALNEEEDNRGEANENNDTEPEGSNKNDQKEFISQQEEIQKDNQNIHTELESLREDATQTANEADRHIPEIQTVNEPEKQKSDDVNVQQDTVHQGNDLREEVKPTTEDNEKQGDNRLDNISQMPKNKEEIKEDANDVDKNRQQNNSQRDSGEQKIQAQKMSEQKEGEGQSNKQIFSEPVVHQNIQQQQIDDEEFGEFDEGEQANQYSTQVNRFLQQLPDYSGLLNLEIHQKPSYDP